MKPMGPWAKGTQADGRRAGGKQRADGVMGPWGPGGRTDGKRPEHQNINRKNNIGQRSNLVGCYMIADLDNMGINGTAGNHLIYDFTCAEPNTRHEKNSATQGQGPGPRLGGWVVFVPRIRFT